MLAGCRGGGWSPEGLEISYMPRFATGFEIYRYGEHSSVLKIENPWQGARGVDNYVFISRKGEAAPRGFDGVTLTAPLRRVGCMSSSHIAFLDAIGRTDVVTAVSGLRYITNPTIQERAGAGEVKDVGYEGNINCELLAMLRPGAVFMYSVAGERLPVMDKMAELGIPVVMIGDYLEADPLGKAEWIVAFGEIFNRREWAERAFGEVSALYTLYRDVVRDVEERPSVMLNAPWRETWFVPGDRSYMVRLLQDAGARYVCEGYDTEQSRAINGETAYIYASQADYWLNPNEASTLSELLQANPKFADIPPVLNGHVYNNRRRSTEAGGSDFWESGAVRPDRVLQDLIGIFHPDKAPGHELFYYERLE